MTAALSSARREQAASHFRSRGVPHRRVEDWKYSDLRSVVGEVAEVSAAWSVGALPPGVELFDLSRADAPQWVRDHLGVGRETALGAASLAFAQTGVALRVTGAVEAPLTLAFSGTGHVRALIVLDANAELTLVERQTGDDAALRNTGIEIMLAPNAVLHHVRLADAAPDAARVEDVAMTLARDARYTAHYASFGARLSRLELDIALEGEGAQAHLSGVSVLGDTHADITTRMRHVVGNTASSQLFKKVAGGKSRAVYQGRVSVSQGADKSDSRQTAKALLIGHRAEADLKPELEIFADDVKCAHGAAVGDLDADSLFYLRARGIPEDQARDLLIHAFLEDALASIAHEDLRDMVREAVNGALGQVAA